MLVMVQYSLRSGNGAVHEGGKRFHDHGRRSPRFQRYRRQGPAAIGDLEREWGEFSVETDSLTLQSYEKWLKEKRAA